MVHEIGHVLIGLKEGFDFALFVVGPFGLKKNEAGKIVFYIEKDPSLWGGVAATVPKDKNENNYKKFGRVLLAGPIASFLFGALCLPFGIMTDNMFLSLLGYMPLAMGLVTILPLRNGAFYSDGGRWLRMNKWESTRAVEMATWNIIQETFVNKKLSDSNLNDIKVLTSDDDYRTQYVGHYFAHTYYKEVNDKVKMKETVNTMDGLKGKVSKQMVTLYGVNK
jgi:hypothetical protein